MHLIFDIGGTYARCARVSEGKIQEHIKKPTPKDFSAGMTMCQEMAGEVLRGETPEHVVVGIAGSLDREKRRLFRSPHLPLWNGKNIAEKLEKILGTSISLENDSALAGLGEAVYGAGRGKKIVAYMTVGTGVGGVRIVDGKIDANVWGFEPGHQIIFAEKKIQELGVSGASIEEKTGKDPSEITDENFWGEKSKVLAVGIANVILLWSPDVVVLGGSVGARMDLGVVESETQKHLAKILAGAPPIVRAELGDDSGLWGGISLINAGVESAGVQKISNL